MTNREQLASIYPQAWRWALHCARWDQDLAFDALQDACMQLLEGLAPSNPAAFRSFAFSVISRQVTRHRRSARWRRWFRWPITPELSATPAENSLSACPDLQRHLAQLSTRQRDVIALVLLCEFSIEEAATALNLRLGTARTHYARGKKQLRALMGEQAP